MRLLPRIGLLGTMLAVCLWATTLEQLSLDEVIQKSTAIVRGRVTGSYPAYRGASIYTFYQIEVSENWKAPGASQRIDVAVPGGVIKGVRQSVAGAPSLNVGDEYVIFVWTSRSGLSQVMGLSQGLFNVKVDASGNALLVRPAALETMLGKNGQVVEDQALTMRVADMRSRVQRNLGVAP